MAQRIHVRQLVFPLRAGQPFVLRIETSSAMQLYATVWRSTGLMAWLSSVEWASGVHQGVNLVLTLLIAGAALALRMRSLMADRKSTRLNSSHLVISYAVFCL